MAPNSQNLPTPASLDHYMARMIWRESDNMSNSIALAWARHARNTDRRNAVQNGVNRWLTRQAHGASDINRRKT